MHPTIAVGLARFVSRGRRKKIPLRLRDKMNRWEEHMNLKATWIFLALGHFASRNSAVASATDVPIHGIARRLTFRQSNLES